MEIDVVLRLEKKIDELLDRKRQLEEDCQRLLAEKKALAEERERFRTEIDRILAKLDHLDQESP
jgi:cell division protein ZapB